MIGSALVPELRTAGHDVVRLVRRRAQHDDEVAWDPQSGSVDHERLGSVQAFVNLAGAGVGDHRWTDSYREVIRRSRVDATTTVARTAAELDPRPSVVVSASAIGYYGETGEREVDESAPRGDTFLAGVAEQWERAADPARGAGIRVVHTRSGLVLTPRGGAWGRMLPLFRLGAGGRLGNGRQWWSWITLTDELRAITFLLRSDLAGPFNLTAPTPATNAEVTRAMGGQLHRPTPFPVPAMALRLVLGGFSSEVLASMRVLPRRLSDAGFSWEHPDLGAAVGTLR
jgi:uncharacterized protein (TIGR01777 family)